MSDGLDAAPAPVPPKRWYQRGFTWREALIWVVLGVLIWAVEPWGLDDRGGAWITATGARLKQMEPGSATKAGVALATCADGSWILIDTHPACVRPGRWDAQVGVDSQGRTWVADGTHVCGYLNAKERFASHTWPSVEQLMAGAETGIVFHRQ